MPDRDGAQCGSHRQVTKTPEEKSAHRRRINIKDIIRDEIYGAAMKPGGEESIGGKDVICIPAEDVKKIAKRIVRRTSIGPR